MAAQKLVIEVSRSTIWTVLGIFIGLAVVVRLQNLIFYLLFALLFAVAIAPLITWFQKRGLNHSSALAVVMMLMVTSIFFVVGVMVFSLIDTITSFVTDLPTYIEGLRQYSVTADHVDRILEAYEQIDIQQVLQDGIASSGNLIAGVSKSFEAVLFTFFFTIYMLLERDYLLRILHRVVPKGWKPRMRDLEREFVEVVGSYIRGQVLTSTLMGLASYFIFRALGIPNALALGIIAGITDIIPVVGGLIGLIPAVLVAMTVSPVTALAAVVLVQTYSTFSNYFIRPRVFGDALDMSPFIVIVATMIGLLLFGLPGIILALPAAAMIGYILTKYYNVPLIEED